MNMKKCRKFRQYLVLSFLFPLLTLQGDPNYKNPERYTDVIVGFEKSDIEAPPPTGAVVFVGSSSIRVWRSLSEDLNPIVSIQRGFGGSTTRDALYFLDRVVMNYAPRAVVVYEGENDIAHGVSPENVVLEFSKLVDAIHARDADCSVYFISIKPTLARWSIWPDCIKANAGIEKICEVDGRLTYIDVASVMLNEEGTPREEIFVEDGIHMNEIGYVSWRSVIRPVLLAKVH